METLNLSMCVNNSTDTKREKRERNKSHKNLEKLTISAGPSKPPMRRFELFDRKKCKKSTNYENRNMKRARIKSYHFPVLVSSTSSQQAPPCVQVEHPSKVAHGFHPHYYVGLMTSCTDMEEENIHIGAKIYFTNSLALARISKKKKKNSLC